jgi:3-oxoacyl-[acyl-carrier-protein] synthase-3
MTFAARITGTGSALPAKRITNDDLAEHLAKLGVETTDEWIRDRTGIGERRYTDLSNPEETNAGLATTAAMRAIEMAGKKPEDIDQIIVATCSPETTLPSIACWMQHKIGATRAWAMDINAACSGFLYGIITAGQFIQTGQIKTSLVVGSEVMHSLLNWQDRGSCILFGDAAGAAVIESVPLESENRILSWHLRSDGSHAELLYMPALIEHPDGPLCQEQIRSGKIHMNGREIFKIAVRTLAEFARSVLDKHGATVDDVDWFVPHQANQRILEAVAQRLGIAFDKVLINVNRLGNTSAATIPTALDEAVRDGRIKKGQLLLLDAFGAGFTYGAVLIRW